MAIYDALKNISLEIATDIRTLKSRSQFKQASNSTIINGVMYFGGGVGTGWWVRKITYANDVRNSVNASIANNDEQNLTAAWANINNLEYS